MSEAPELNPDDPLFFLRDEKASQEFRADEVFSVPRDLPTWDGQGVPQGPGAYILMTQKQKFLYPWRKESRVFYIGQGDPLPARLLDHRGATRQAAGPRAKCLYRQVYEYGAAFGAHFSFVSAGQGRSPKKLETLLLALFARYHGALPVANGAADWDHIREIIIDMGLPPHAPKFAPPAPPPDRDQFGNPMLGKYLPILWALTTEHKTPQEVSANTSKPWKNDADCCERRLDRIMKRHPECRVGKEGGKYFLEEEPPRGK
jgi:hypothetical protein